VSERGDAGGSVIPIRQEADELPIDEGPYLEDLFEAIAPQPREVWGALIAESCRGDSALAEELQALLAAHDVTARHELVSGDRVGRYALERVLGTGATAHVWQAFDTRLQRSVALKVFRDARGSGVRQVLQEAQATSDVVSDFVIRVQDVSDESAGPPYYMDMELCAEYAGRGELDVGLPMSETRPHSREEVVRWLMESALGVQAAHENNVFHRDIKPDNILIRPMSRRAQVTDFGLAARQLDPTQGLNTPGDRTVTLTAGDGQVRIAGTPVYMAPEQARGLPVSLDPARHKQRKVLVGLDVYGLGATLYTALSGRKPYAADPSSPTPVTDVLRQVRLGVLPSVRGGRFPVTPRLARVVEKAMAREPADRYPSAAELADDLRRFMVNLPTSQDVGRPWLTLALSTRRNWRAVSAGLAVAVMIVAGIGSALIVSDAREEAAQAQAEALSAEAETVRALDAASAARVEAAGARSEADGAREATTQALKEKDAADQARVYSVAQADKAVLAARAATGEALEEIEGLEETQTKLKEARGRLEIELRDERGTLAETSGRLVAEIAAHEMTAGALMDSLIAQKGLERQLTEEREARRDAETRSADALAAREAAEAALAREMADRQAVEDRLQQRLSERERELQPEERPAPTPEADQPITDPAQEVATEQP